MSTASGIVKLSALADQWSTPHPGPLQAALNSLGGTQAVTDLITASPLDHGLCFPPEKLAECVALALQSETVSRYRPDARGQLQSREAVAAWYARRGHSVDPESVLLTPGTSLAYLMCFRLLCNRGDEVLVPEPGYPLFDDLATMAGVKLRRWHLSWQGNRWGVDLEEIRFQITPRTKAIVVVSPHNPTGHMFTAADLEGLAAICNEHGVALIFDEVFSEWLSPGEALPRPVDFPFPLAILLNGVSKMLTLPQWKLAWLVASGNPESVARFLRGAEHYSDALLAVSELPQAILASLLGSEEVILRIQEEINRRRTVLRRAVTLPLASEDRGVYLCVRLSDGDRDETEALRFLEQRRVLVHPGYYYDLPGHLILTCINPAGEFVDLSE